MVKVNGTIDALAQVVKELIRSSNWRLDSLVQVESDTASLFVELLNNDKEGAERYVAILDTDLLTAAHLASVLGIEMEYWNEE